MYDQPNTSTSDNNETRVPSPDYVRAQLSRMLQCRLFRHSPRLSRFFTFTVEQALAGAEQRLKEYSIALEVFGKPETFDPRMDSAVRVAARQLRAKIDLYYLTEGAQDPVLIRYRPGDYIPKFYSKSDAPAAGPADGEGETGTRPVIIVEKDRASIRSLTDVLDAMSFPIIGVVDCAERCMELVSGAGSCIVVTALNLLSSMSGTDLVRALRDHADVATVMLVPSAVDSQLLDELLACEPDALLYEPIRPADVRIGLRIAATRRGQFRNRAEKPELVSCV